MSDRFLLLDDRFVAETENLKLELGRPKKSPRNPLFSEEFFADPPKRWEARYDNLYPNVIYDAEAGLFKLWYNAFIRDADTPLDERPHRPYDVEEGRVDGLLYAVSHDGLSWTKPNLGLVPFEGSTDNNIVISSDTRGIHGVGVLEDPADPLPVRRYKAFFRSIPGRRMAVAFSSDGLHWGESVLWPEHNVVGDTHNNAIWSPDLGRYVGITRGWVGSADERVRMVPRTESEDFVHWSDPVNVFQGKDTHDQIYSMPVFRVGGSYLGLPAIFHKGDQDAADWDTVDTELAWSPDTVSWHRVNPGEPLIPRGEGSYPDGAYDCGCIYAAAALLVGDTHYLYYGGSNGLHNGWREGSFDLATLPRDRFAGYAAGRDPGRLTTAPLALGEGGIAVNVAISEGGSLRAGILGEAGCCLEGFGLEACDPIIEGGLDAAVSWQGRPGALGGRSVQLVFSFQGATLFALAGG